MKKQLNNLYVWHPALTDYSDGIIVAYAASLDEARAEIMKMYPNSDMVKSEISAMPKIFKGGTVAYAVWGGS